MKVILCTNYDKIQAIRHDFREFVETGIGYKEAYFRACYENLTEGRLFFVAACYLVKLGYSITLPPLKFGMFAKGNYSH